MGRGNQPFRSRITRVNNICRSCAGQANQPGTYASDEGSGEEEEDVSKTTVPASQALRSAEGGSKSDAMRCSAASGTRVAGGRSALRRRASSRGQATWSCRKAAPSVATIRT